LKLYRNKQKRNRTQKTCKQHLHVHFKSVSVLQFGRQHSESFFAFLHCTHLSLCAVWVWRRCISAFWVLISWFRTCIPPCSRSTFPCRSLITVVWPCSCFLRFAMTSSNCCKKREYHSVAPE
jgi:hypothetical protein